MKKHFIKMLILGLLFSIFAFNNVSQIHADDTSTRIDITTDIRDKLLYSDEYETYLDKYGESPNHNSTFDNRFLFTSDEKTNVNYRIFYFIFILNNDTSSIEIGNDLDNFYYIYSDEIKHDSLDYSLKYELYFADKEINLVGSPATGNILDTSEEKILDVKIPSEAAYFVIQLTFTSNSFSDDKYQDLIPLIYVIEHKNNEKEKPQLKIVYFVSPDDERFYNNVNNKDELNNIIDISNDGKYFYFKPNEEKPRLFEIKFFFKLNALANSILIYNEKGNLATNLFTENGTVFIDSKYQTWNYDFRLLNNAVPVEVDQTFTQEGDNVEVLSSKVNPGQMFLYFHATVEIDQEYDKLDSLDAIIPSFSIIEYIGSPDNFYEEAQVWGRLSFSYSYESQIIDENMVTTYNNFNNITLQFKCESNYFFANNIDEHGICITTDYNAFVELNQGSLNSLPANTLTYSSNDSSKYTFIFSLENIPLTSYETNIYVCSYILCDGVYYFSFVTPYTLEFFIDSYLGFNDIIGTPTEDILNALYKACKEAK